MPHTQMYVQQLVGLYCELCFVYISFHFSEFNGVNNNGNIHILRWLLYVQSYKAAGQLLCHCYGYGHRITIFQMQNYSVAFGVHGVWPAVTI